MAINQNHTFDDLDGIKCAIVEKNASQARVDFLKPLLEYNGYEVVVIPSPPAKGAAPVPEGETPPPPSSFTIGVSDVTFNPTNAIYGRLLKTAGGQIVTLAYWQQKEQKPSSDKPYFAK